MKKLWIALIAPPTVVLFIWLFGELLMHLWNWLLPPIFGLHMITFWQALGLLLLSRILFGSWGSGGGNRGRRSRREKWDKVTPEERERLRQSWGSRCGGFANAGGENKELA
jgi:Ca2+/H+ antiporter, TMEM165/GDT1 family